MEIGRTAGKYMVISDYGVDGWGLVEEFDTLQQAMHLGNHGTEYSMTVKVIIPRVFSYKFRYCYHCSYELKRNTLHFGPYCQRCQRKKCKECGSLSAHFEYCSRKEEK